MKITESQKIAFMRGQYEERLFNTPLRGEGINRLDTRLGRPFIFYSVDSLHVVGQVNYLSHRHYLDLSWLHEEGKWRIQEFDLDLFDFVTGEKSKHEKFVRAHGKYLLDLALEYIDRHPAMRREAICKHLRMTLKNGLDLIDNHNFWDELDVAESGFRLADRPELAKAIAKVRKSALEARELLRSAQSPRRRARAAA